MIGFLGLITSVWAEKFDHAAAVTNFVVTPLALLSGTFYSVDRLAPWFQSVAHANPVYHAIMGFRYGFIGSVDSTMAHPVATAVAFLVAVNIVLGAITHRLLRSEEHTSELQSLMRISYAVFCLKQKKHNILL